MTDFLARFMRWVRRDSAAREVELAAHSGDDTHNSGIACLNGSAAALKQKTVIVLGAPRGGTSMVAGAIAHLGIYMGQTRSAVYEDYVLSECFRREDIAAARSVIAERNARYNIWGFKKPRMDLLKPRWQKLFRERVYVVVLRDPLAIANRRSVTRDDDLLVGMRVVLRQQSALLNFVRRTDRPCLLVSYEKALLDPAFFVRQLATFLGDIDDAAIAAAEAFVTPSPDTYRRAARVEKPRQSAAGQWRGHFERVGEEHAVGWAFLVSGRGPLQVELRINGVLRATQATAVSRQDVQRRFGLASEYCGFSFVNGEHAQWHAGDSIAVRVLGEGEDLNNSPQICRV